MPNSSDTSEWFYGTFNSSTATANKVNGPWYFVDENGAAHFNNVKLKDKQLSPMKDYFSTLKEKLL